MSPTATRKAAAPAPRLDVRKTYKLYIGGAFPRSESGRSYVVSDTKGRFLANASQASRKDARDAVVAARAAFPGWPRASPPLGPGPPSPPRSTAGSGTRAGPTSWPRSSVG